MKISYIDILILCLFFCILYIERFSIVASFYKKKRFFVRSDCKIKATTTLLQQQQTR